MTEQKDALTEQKNGLAQLFAKCWKDEALKARIMADPKAVMKDNNLYVPDGIDVKVVENADDCVHITLPAPPAGHMDLPDDELIYAAEGVVLFCFWVDDGHDVVITVDEPTGAALFSTC